MAAQSKYARLWSAFHAATDHCNDADLDWIPAHTTEAEVPTRISAQDRKGNDVADIHAQAEANAIRPPVQTRIAVARQAKLVATVARWIGIASALANTHDARDSTACPAKSRQRRTAAAIAAALKPKKQRDAVRDPRPPALGGHTLVATAEGWKCATCRRTSASWNRLAAYACPGSAVARWANRAADDHNKGILHHQGHSRWLSDDTIWCARCGAYTTEAAVGLTRPCHSLVKGTTTVWSRLCRGFHPRSNLPFARAAIPEHHWQTLPAPPTAQKPPTAAAAECKPRGSAAANKRRHSATVPTRRNALWTPPAYRAEPTAAPLPYSTSYDPDGAPFPQPWLETQLEALLDADPATPAFARAATRKRTVRNWNPEAPRNAKVRRTDAHPEPAAPPARYRPAAWSEDHLPPDAALRQQACDAFERELTDTVPSPPRHAPAPDPATPPHRAPPPPASADASTLATLLDLASCGNSVVWPPGWDARSAALHVHSAMPVAVACPPADRTARPPAPSLTVRDPPVRPSVPALPVSRAPPPCAPPLPTAPHPPCTPARPAASRPAARTRPPKRTRSNAPEAPATAPAPPPAPFQHQPSDVTPAAATTAAAGATSPTMSSADVRMMRLRKRVVTRALGITSPPAVSDAVTATFQSGSFLGVGLETSTGSNCGATCSSSRLDDAPSHHSDTPPCMTRQRNLVDSHSSVGNRGSFVGLRSSDSFHQARFPSIAESCTLPARIQLKEQGTPRATESCGEPDLPGGLSLPGSTPSGAKPSTEARLANHRVSDDALGEFAALQGTASYRGKSARLIDTKRNEKNEKNIYAEPTAKKKRVLPTSPDGLGGSQ
jgi:hypothetical protein